MLRTPIRIGAVLVPLALAACRDAAAPYTPLPAEMRIESGDAQVSEAGTELVRPIEVTVLDAYGHPVREQQVTFHVVAGGGSLSSGSALTDRRGVAQDRWTLGPSTADAQRVEARVVTAAGAVVPPVTFSATVVPGRGVSLRPAPARNPPAVGGTDTVAVTVTDRFGNGVRGVPVSWVADAGASVVAESTTTNLKGAAEAWWVLPLRYDTVYRLTARADTMSLSFTVTPILPRGMVLERTSGDNQHVRVGSPLAPLAATLRLADGRPVQGVPVTWGWSEYPNPSPQVTVVTGADGVSRFDPSGIGHPTVQTAPNGLELPYFVVASAMDVAEAWFTYLVRSGPATRVQVVVDDTFTHTFHWPPGKVFTNQPLFAGIHAADAGYNTAVGDTLYLAVASGGGSVAPTILEIEGGCWIGQGGPCDDRAVWTLGPNAGENVLEIRNTAGDVLWRGSLMSEAPHPPPPPNCRVYMEECQ